MHTEPFIRILAGGMILLSLSLAHWVDTRWLFFTAFIGLNLIQSAFTGFCPPEWLAYKFGWVKRSSSPAPSP